jgi:hypothetical protein
MGEADTFSDVTDDVAPEAAQLTGHDLVGPTLVWAVSLEKTERRVLTEAFPRFSRVVEVVGRRSPSPCDTCKARFLSILNGMDLTALLESQGPL